MNFNYLNILNMIKSGQNPQQLIMSFLESNMANSPIGANLLQMAQNNDGQGIEQVARNICQQKGIDFDKEFSSFRKMLNI